MFCEFAILLMIYLVNFDVHRSPGHLGGVGKRCNMFPPVYVMLWRDEGFVRLELDRSSFGVSCAGSGQVS